MTQTEQCLKSTMKTITKRRKKTGWKTARMKRRVIAMSKRMKRRYWRR